VKILGTSFLIDYLNGDESTKHFYEANNTNTERCVIPVSVCAEASVEKGNFPNGDVEGARANLA